MKMLKLTYNILNKLKMLSLQLSKNQMKLKF